MGDLYIFDPGGDPEGRERRQRERAESRAQVRARYADLIVGETGVDDMTADLVMTVLFDHNDADGDPCPRNTHPQLPEAGEHSFDAGFDCPCTWDAARNEQEMAARRAAWDAWSHSPEAEALRKAEEDEMATVAEWLRNEPGVDANRTVTACPEVWEGHIDGHTFWFRERHGEWRIELDLAPDGRTAERLVGTAPDGNLITERVELGSGEIIAQGVDSELGANPTDHLAFIVRTVRDHLRSASCSHRGAHRFCPACGARMTAEE